MARTALIVGFVSAVIILCLVGIVMFESLQRKNEELPPANGAVSSFFFVRDPEFTTPTIPSASWGVEAWNKNLDSISEIANGALHLFYNGTRTYVYGNSGAFQGRHADGRFTNQSLLIGKSPQEAVSSENLVFNKTLPSGRFWVKARFKIDRMGYNSFPSAVNLGITLMCAINNNSFSIQTQPLWLDVYFAGYIPYRTNIGTVPKDLHYVNYRDDGIHAGYYVGEVQPSDFGIWVEVSADLGDYMSKTLNLITQVTIETIRVYGFIVFLECVGAYAEAEYDYVETYVTL
jgi:hypothetical protein